jgi:pilus assembly protein TadC
MKFKKIYLIGISLGILLLIIDFLYFFGKDSIGNGRFFYALIIISLSITWLQFWLDFFKENKIQKEIEEKFTEFVRAIVSSVKSGITIPNAIIQVSNKDYGALSPSIKKLANQIQWGIPIQEALLNFSKSTHNKEIKRSISIVIEAEQSGGDIVNVLSSVTNSMINIKKMKADRKASTFPQIIQGYIVFFIFIAIMLVLQLGLFPHLGKLTGTQTTTIQKVGFSFFGTGNEANLDVIFFSLVMIQGFFAGLAIGKFSEGTLRQGLLHSLILITSAALIISVFNPSAFPLNFG